MPHSYGYGGTGKTVENNNYQTYGEPFGPGDVIGCFVVCCNVVMSLGALWYVVM